MHFTKVNKTPHEKAARQVLVCYRVKKACYEVKAGAKVDSKIRDLGSRQQAMRQSLLDAAQIVLSPSSMKVATV